MSKEKRIVVGCKGEIGRAIANIFEATKELDLDYTYHSSTKQRYGKTDKTILHICIPFFKPSEFVATVIEYIRFYNPDLTIIHSTCAIGTTREIWNQFDLGEVHPNIVHCPVNGRHPNMEKDIRLYDMFVGALDEATGDEACDYIERFGIRTYLFDTPESTEFCKIASTEYCRKMVEFFGRMKDLVGEERARKYRDYDEIPYRPRLDWKEVIIFFEALMSKGDGWKRMYRRGNRIDTKMSGKHCLSSNQLLLDRYFQ